MQHGCPGSPGKVWLCGSQDPRSAKRDSTAISPLEESEELERLFELCLEMLCIADTGGHFRRLNAAFQRTLGYELTELLSRPIVEFVHPEDRQRTLDEIGKLSRGIPTVQFENRYCCKDGSYRWLAWTAMPEEQRGLIYATARDITDARRSEGLLRESEERFRRLADLSPAGIYLTAPNGDCVYVNRRWCEMAGMDATSAMGRGWIAAIHPDDRQYVADRWRAMVQCEGKWEFEYRMQTPKGKVTWVFGQAAALCDRQGDAFGYVGTNTDITERKRSEETVRDSERRYRELLAAVTNYRYSVNLKDGWPTSTEHTPGCLATTGYCAEEYALDPYLWINMVHAEDRQAVLAQVARVLRQQRVPPLEHRILHKDGSTRWVRSTIVAHCDDTGALTRYDGLIEEITERRRLEESVREREAQLLVARKIQKRLLPQRPPEFPAFEIAGTSHATDFVGGDYFDYFRMPDGSTGIVIADVAGHGLPAALLASSTHTLLRSLANHHQEMPEILSVANSVLMDQMDDDLFVTALLMRLDSGTRSFLYTSAGHPPAYLLDRSGEAKVTLGSTGLPLAVLAGTDFPNQGPYRLEPGDVLLLVTDGITEATSACGESFGTERMLEVVRSHRHLAASEIVAGLCQAVEAFVQPGKAMDDVTAVVVKGLAD